MTALVEFDLRSLVREEIESSAVADPHVLAEHIAKLVPDENLRAALEQCLANTVRMLVAEARRSASMAAATQGSVGAQPSVRSRGGRLREQADV